MLLNTPRPPSGNSLGEEQKMKTVHRTRNRALATGASLGAILLASGAAFAQDSDSNTLSLEEIVVTAQKRAQSTQDVPVSITAFDANFTKRVNLDDVKDLVKFAPGFSGDSKDSFIDYINIRGISTNDFGVGGDPSVGFFKNGLYQGRNGVVVTSMFDMERAEVLRGPQGFLFGRNAISGAVSLHTQKPNFDDNDGYVEVGLGERGIFEAEGAINLPMSDNFALRLAAYHSEENGYVDNTARPNDDKLVAHDKSAFRATAAMRGESWDATVMAEYEDRDQSGSIYRLIRDDVPENDGFSIVQHLKNVLGEENVLPGGNKRDVGADQKLGNYDRGEVLSLSAEINVDLEFATLTSMTGYKDHDYEYAEDFDGMPIGFNDYGQIQSGDYFEQELRLVSNGDGPLSWYAGVSYYKENIDAHFDQRADEEVMCLVYYYYSCSEVFAYYEWGEFTPNAVGLLESNDVTGSYEGWGAYLDLTYAVSDKFEVGMGLRYSKDTKEFGNNILPVESELGPFWAFGVTTDGFVTGKHSWDDFTPRFVARYRPNDDWMIYASATRGFKAGGFGSFAVEADDDDVNDDLVAENATLNQFDPETVWSYEVGVKGDMFDRRIRMDMSVYHYRYKDLQLNYFDKGTRVTNVGKVKATGIEGTVQAILSENFDLFLSTSYNDNEISNVDPVVAEGVDGNTLPGTPKFTFAGLLSYHQPIGDDGEINASIDWRTQTKTYGGLDNIDLYAQEGWSDFSARVGYESNSGWQVVAYVENIFNRMYYDGTAEGGDFFPGHGFGISRPRTFGARFTYRFGS